MASLVAVVGGSGFIFLLFPFMLFDDFVDNDSGGVDLRPFVGNAFGNGVG
jgi:hypothetical protein